VVLDAKTGNYQHHVKIVPKDWHDWDVSNPPILIRSMGGKELMLVAPKDGHLYGFDLTDNRRLYRLPVTQVENVAETFQTDVAVRFCPGAAGGAEWNSPAYDPKTNLVLIGEVDWCD
jgi:glucose dehydrogenase